MPPSFIEKYIIKIIAHILKMDTIQKQNSNSTIQNFNNHKFIQLFEHVQFFIEGLF
jgi:hypothetical protein